MPWQETCAMEQRMRLIAELLRKAMPVSTVCACYGVSRQTAYKWRTRFARAGLDGLRERSRRPLTMPQAMPAAVREEIVATRRAHPTWGPRKLRAYLRRHRSHQVWPAASTIGDLLRRQGLVERRRRPRRTPQTVGALRQPVGPNSVWGADFKGHFRLGDGTRCHPLTVSDLHSRFLLRCQALPAEREALVRPVFEDIFRRYGLPECIRTDNGAPFASRAPGGLSRLSAWWLKLGIWPERIVPGCPQQNGCHERLHRTLKAATIRPPRPTLAAQQRAFARFHHEYNTLRPHAALGEQPPTNATARRRAPIRGASRSPATRRTSKCAGSARTVRSNGAAIWCW